MSTALPSLSVLAGVTQSALPLPPARNCSMSLIAHCAGLAGRARWARLFFSSPFAAACLAVVAMIGTGTVANAQPRAIRVGIVTDGPSNRETLSVDMLEREAANVLPDDIKLQFPAAARYAGDLTSASVDAALDRALADPGVDVVLTLGMLASHTAAHREHLPKPVIAPAVADPILQRYPLADGKSGRSKFTYIADFHGLEDGVRTFHSMVEFKHLAALVDEVFLREMPELATKAEQLSQALGISISIVRSADNVDAMLAAIPADADAVYVSVLPRLNDAGMKALARGLIARRLPSFTAVGRSDIENGLLMTTGGTERDAARLSRRIALTIQRLAEGQSAASFDVAFPTEQKLLINMRTAREIGFSPRWQDLADAEQLYAVQEENSQLTLADAMRTALEANPALAATRARLESARDDVRIARSALLPALDASAARTQIDADRASPLTQAERTTAASLAFQQIIYSERAWSNFSISRYLAEASRQGERETMLDTLESTATAYLNLLRAQASEAVRRQNADNTRQNFATARAREQVGLAARSDLLRWQAELARDKQDVLAAESTRRQAETELARILHRTGERPLATVEKDLNGPLAIVSSPRVQALLNTPAKWNIFAQYVIANALKRAPETAQAEAIIASRQRAVSAAQRAYFVPDVALVSNASRTLSRSGAGSQTFIGAPDNESWSVSLQVSLPLFSGGRRRAELAQAKHELKASEADRLTASDAVAARARAALQRTASSYPAIALSNEASAAANENLTMVTAAYARGAVSITDLIDAQDTALSAWLGAAEAKYIFLIDFVAVLRSMNEFDILLDPWARERWLKDVEQWFQQQNAGAGERG